MKRSELGGEDRIFVVANIFVYHFTGNGVYGHICSDFLERIELAELEAVTTSLVLDEAVYAILITAASEATGITRIKTLQKRLRSDVHLSTECYSRVLAFLEYIEVLRDGGLTVMEGLGMDQLKAAAELGMEGFANLTIYLS